MAIRQKKGLAVTALVLLLIAATSLAAMAASSDRALLILNSDSAAELKAAIEALKDAGANPAHVLPPNVVIAGVPAAIENAVHALPNVAELHREIAPEVSDATDANIALGISIWNKMLCEPSAQIQSTTTGAPLVGDAFEAPLSEGPIAAASLSSAPGFNQTSEFMLGDVVVGIVLPESIGSDENWSYTRQQQVIQEIVDGLNWWVNKIENEFGWPAKLTFYYEYELSVPTNYEPIQTNGTSSQGYWISNVMTNLGYTGSDHFAKTRNYINDLRSQYDTDWSVAVYVVDSLNDTDGRFNDNYFAWAYINGPYVVMTYDNDGHGINNMDKVLAHEIGHIFGAGDEYCDPGYACCDFNNYGYLGVYNGNCEDGNPNSVDCIMKHNSNTICSYTRGQIGWRDSDGDYCLDPVDNVVEVSIDNCQDNGDGTFTFNGLANDVPCVSPSRADITINTIDTVAYCIDGGTWYTATATDGSFDSDTENYEFTTLVLPPGDHVITVKAFSSSGNVSSQQTYNVTTAAGTYQMGDTTFDWIDPSSHTQINVDDDDYATITLPFTFQFYGEDVTTIHVGSNGLVTLTDYTGANAHYNTQIPTVNAPNNALYPYWDDLNPTASGASVRVGTIGQAPNRKFVASWIKVPHYNTNTEFTFQVVLEETSNKITFQYLDVQPNNYTYGAGRAATVGIEDSAGTAAMQYSYDGSTLLQNQQAIAFSPVSTTEVTLVEAKQSGDGTGVSVKGNVITYSTSDILYVEDLDRICGIKVYAHSHGLTLNDLVDIKGTMATDQVGERYISAISVTKTGTGSVKPIAFTHRTLGGADWQYDAVTGSGQMGVTSGYGLNTIGLFVKITGKITSIDYNYRYMYIDDGTGLIDGTYTSEGDQNIGVRVNYFFTADHLVGEHISVTGICSCFSPSPGVIAPQIFTGDVKSNIRVYAQ